MPRAINKWLMFSPRSKSALALLAGIGLVAAVVAALEGLATVLVLALLLVITAVARLVFHGRRLPGLLRQPAAGASLYYPWVWGHGVIGTLCLAAGTLTATGAIHASGDFTFVAYTFAIANIGLGLYVLLRPSHASPRPAEFRRPQSQSGRLTPARRCGSD
jgi:hypothetical protein